MLEIFIWGWGQGWLWRFAETPGGTSILGGQELGPQIKFGGKSGARSGQVHHIRGKTLEVLLPQDAKVGVFVTYIFGCKIWGSDKNFRDK